jgi:hypothetical protein
MNASSALLTGRGREQEQQNENQMMTVCSPRDYEEGVAETDPVGVLQPLFTLCS